MLPAVLIVGAIVAVAGALLRAWLVHQRGLSRIAAAVADTPSAAWQEPADGPLTRWLARAGFGRADAPVLFVAASAGALATGVAAAWLSRGVAAAMAADVADLPGGIGDSVGAALDMLPWALLLGTALTPTLVVRRARRTRVADVDRDLPLVLELLATLAQAGLGLDSALARVTEVQPPARPLTAELRAFQRDLLAGVPRVQALRHLSSRVDVTSLTVFVAAVIQAEQVGASIAETLRLQADDLRARRREQALLLAQSLPVKLVLPLVACFLPGIFLSTLGPVLYQMLQVADSVLRPVGR